MMIIPAPVNLLLTTIGVDHRWFRENVKAKESLLQKLERNMLGGHFHLGQ